MIIVSVVFWKVWSLRKHAYWNIQKYLPSKTENFQIKKKKTKKKKKRCIFAQNIDCGYLLEPPQRGGSNLYPQSMFFSKNKKKICIVM